MFNDEFNAPSSTACSESRFGNVAFKFWSASTVRETSATQIITKKNSGVLAVFSGTRTSWKMYDVSRLSVVESHQYSTLGGGSG